MHDRGSRLRFLPRCDAKRLVLLAVMVVAAGLFLVVRLAGIEGILWFDEIFSVSMASRPVSEIPATVAVKDSHPPLYYMVLSLWRSLSTADAWARGLSLLAAAVHVVVLLRITRALGGRIAAASAALLLAVAPALAWTGYETRNFALFNVFASLAWLFALRARRGDRLRDYGGLAVCTALACYTFYYGLLVAGALGVGFLATRPRRAQVGRYALAMVTAALLFLPWLPVLLQQAEGVRAHSADSVAPPPTVFDASLRAWIGELGPWHAFGALPRNGLLLVLAVVLVGLGLFLVRRARWPKRPRFRTLLVVAVTGLAFAVLVWLAGRLGSFVHVRYLSFLAGVWCVLAALVLRRLPAVPAVALLFALVYGGLRQAEEVTWRRYLEPWDEVAAVVDAERSPGDAVWAHPHWYAIPYRHYGRRPLPPVHGVVLDVPGRPPGPTPRGLPPDHVPAVLALAERFERIWLIHLANDAPGVPVGEPLRAALATRGWRVVSDARRGPIGIWRFERPAR